MSCKEDRTRRKSFSLVELVHRRLRKWQRSDPRPQPASHRARRKKEKKKTVREKKRTPNKRIPSCHAEDDHVHVDTGLPPLVYIVKDFESRNETGK